MYRRFESCHPSHDTRKSPEITGKPDLCRPVGAACIPARENWDTWWDTCPARRRSAAGPYLIRSGRTYYFRKRLPKVITEKSGRSFLRLSLRTPLRFDAMSRAARLIAPSRTP
uniref:DUF6538 domain-containing protein n=1 Tax=Salibaculum sp. TaxID=2855480 RepID=UPI00386A82F3